MNSLSCKTICSIASKAVILLFFCGAFLNLKAEVRITDATTGQPLPKASLFDKFGLFIGVADDKGVVPSTISNLSYPLNIRYVGYQPIEVASPDAGIVGMQESTYDLPEIVVDDVARNLLYLQAFVRDFTTLEDANDTLGHYTEQIVDYVIPIGKKAKFKGWKKPRTLATKTYKQIKAERKNKSVDSLSYNENYQKFSPGFSITDKFVMPTPIAAGEVTEYVIDGKYSPEEKWFVIGDNYIVEKDAMSDYKDHYFQPAFLKMFAASAAMSKNESRYKFEKGDKAPGVENLVEASLTWDMILKGKLFKKLSQASDDSKINDYAEMFIIDRAYLTAEEAKDLKKNPPVIESDFKIPSGIPAPPAEIQKLKEKAKKNGNKH